MHITLTGNLGSGKSTICKILENVYNFEIYSTGKVQRTLAEEYGISVLEMNQLMCTDHKYDKMIDDATAKISRENQETNIVFDSRLAWNFVEKSFKVFLSVSLDVAADRVYHDKRGEVEQYATVEDAKKQLRLRAESEDLRYKDIYNIKYFNFKNYNLVLDSTFCTPDILTKVILQEADMFYNNSTKILMSPKRLGFWENQDEIKTEVYYPNYIVKIKKIADDYVVVNGKEIVQKAGKEGYSFVQVEIVS